MVGKRSKILHRLDLALQSGEWWAIPWWQDEQYYLDGVYSKAHAEQAFAALAQVFDAKWFLQQKMPGPLHQVAHPIFGELLQEGLMPFHRLLRLGNDLHTVMQHKGNILGDLRRRLRHHQEFWGAHPELELFAHFLRGGSTIKRNPKSGSGLKRAEFEVVKGPETVFIEIKHLKQSKANTEITNISNGIFYEVIFALATNKSGILQYLELSDTLRQRAKTEEGLGKLRRECLQISQQIKSDILNKIVNGQWGHHIIDDIAEYELSPSTDDQPKAYCSLSGLPLRYEDEANKLVTNALESARVQLPKDSPGILIVISPFSLERHIVESVVNPVWSDEAYRHICGLVLVYKYFGSSTANLLQYHCELILNPYGIQDITHFSATREILSLGK